MKRYEQGMIWVAADERIALNADETSILHTISHESFQGKLAIIQLLKQYCNADKVWRVLELEGDKVHGCYTLSPIITQIGERSPEQYVADVEAAVARFNAAYREYTEKFRAAKIERERNAAYQTWKDYLNSIGRDR